MIINYEDKKLHVAKRTNKNKQNKKQILEKGKDKDISKPTMTLRTGINQNKHSQWKLYHFYNIDTNNKNDDKDNINNLDKDK